MSCYLSHKEHRGSPPRDCTTWKICNSVEINRRQMVLSDIYCSYIFNTAFRFVQPVCLFVLCVRKLRSLSPRRKIFLFRASRDLAGSVLFLSHPFRYFQFLSLCERTPPTIHKDDPKEHAGNSIFWLITVNQVCTCTLPPLYFF